MNFKEFGLKVQALRKSRGFSQEELAHKTGVARRVLQYIEAGRGNPTLETVSSICLELGIPLEIRFHDPDQKVAPDLPENLNIRSIKDAVRETLAESNHDLNRLNKENSILKKEIRRLAEEIQRLRVQAKPQKMADKFIDHLSKQSASGETVPTKKTSKSNKS